MDSESASEIETTMPEIGKKTRKPKAKKPAAAKPKKKPSRKPAKKKPVAKKPKAKKPAKKRAPKTAPKHKLIKGKGQRRSLVIWVLHSEAARVKALAKKAGMSQADYFRMALKIPLVGE